MVYTIQTKYELKRIRCVILVRAFGFTNLHGHSSHYLFSLIRFTSFILNFEYDNHIKKGLLYAPIAYITIFSFKTNAKKIICVIILNNFLIIDITIHSIFVPIILIAFRSS